jgi:hypothetical protein
MFERIHHPIWYQGVRKKRNYFEGWYFKQVTADGKATLSLIPGISKSVISPHAFLHVILAREGQAAPQTWYVVFDQNEFAFGDEPFFVRLGNERFAADRIDLDLDRDGLKLKGSLRLGPFVGIRKSGPFPTIMGPFAYVPFMECYHGVVSMDHALEGAVEVNGEMFSFKGGRGYVEKDWGASFPTEYVWLQTNHFGETGTSLMASVARIPFLGLVFKGFLVNFVHAGTEYRFATYNGSKVHRKDASGDAVTLEFRSGKRVLTLSAKSEHAASLPAPKNGAMDHAIKEGLSGTVEVRLTERGVVLFEGLGKHAGIEIATLDRLAK